ncbi:MAG: hypothetical protein ACJA1B_002503 [Polaribacter sp.]|jgi:hypothetical protein
MKKLKNVILFVCLSVLISCGNSTDDDLGLSGEGSLNAKVAGTTFTSLSATVGATVTNGIAAIQGSNSSGEVIRINISSYLGVGTYKTGDAISNLNSLSYGTITPVAFWTSTFDIGSGTIEITEDSATTVSGTFTFLGYNGPSDRKEVTEGKFSAPKN